MVKLPKWFFHIGWIAWVVAFATLESLAIADPQTGDTLSEHVWWLISYNEIVWVAGAGLMLWMTDHFLLKGLVFRTIWEKIFKKEK